MRLAGLIAWSALTVAPVTAWQRDQGPGPLTVVSFNIRYGTAPDGDNGWEHRRDFLFETFRSINADIAGVQEALRFQLDEMGEACPGYDRIGVGRDDGETKGEYSAIFVRNTRFRILDRGTFWLSDTPKEPGSRSWGNSITRLCTWARLIDLGNRDTLAVFNTHWDHESQPSREKSASLIRTRIREIASKGDRVIVTGDFNAGESNPAFRAMLGWKERPLRDTYRELYPEEAVVGTFNGFRGLTNGEKIDAVLVSDGWKVVNAAIDRRIKEGRTPSDHFPVTAVLLPVGD